MDLALYILPGLVESRALFPIARGAREVLPRVRHRPSAGKGVGNLFFIPTPGREGVRDTGGGTPVRRSVAMTPLARTPRDATRSPSAGLQITPRPVRGSRPLRGVGRRPRVGYREAPSILERSVISGKALVLKR